MGLITYNHTDDNIHELVFHKACRASIEELAKLMEKMYQSDTPYNYCILDLRPSGMLPIRYLTYQMRRLRTAYPQHKPVHIAVVLDDKLMLNMSQVLLRTVMHRDNAQYFTTMDKARAWLHLEQNKAER